MRHKPEIKRMKREDELISPSPLLRPKRTTDLDIGGLKLVKRFTLSNDITMEFQIKTRQFPSGEH